MQSANDSLKQSEPQIESNISNENSNENNQINPEINRNEDTDNQSTKSAKSKSIQLYYEEINHSKSYQNICHSKRHNNKKHKHKKGKRDKGSKESQTVQKEETKLKEEKKHVKEKKHEEEKNREKEKKHEKDKKHDKPKHKEKHKHDKDFKNDIGNQDTSNYSDKKQNPDFHELHHPVLLYSCTLPLQIDDLMNQIEGNEAFNQILSNAGDTNINFTQWEEKDNYKERVINYSKTINIPAVSSKIVKASENHKIFDFGKKFVLVIESNLGKTPFAEDFTPIVHIDLEDKTDSVQYTANMEIYWIKEPFLVKRIIEKDTIKAFKEFYTKFGHHFLKDGDNSNNDHSSQNESKTEDISDYSINSKIDTIKEENEMFAKSFISSVIIFLIVIIFLADIKKNMK